MTSWEREDSRRKRVAELRQLQTSSSSSTLKDTAVQQSTATVSLQSSLHLPSAMSTHTCVLLFITLFGSMHAGLGLPVMKQLEAEAGDVAPTQRVRTRRCACSSELDSECHYFCHLDIIWVNTPSKTTIYGLGSILSRRRRSTGRCSCAKPDDQSCASFCRHSPEVSSVKQHQLNILSILRALASRPKKVLDAADLYRDDSSVALGNSPR